MDSERLTTQPDPGLCGCDREVFRRVWRRVMPNPSPHCPLEVAPPLAVVAPQQQVPLPALHQEDTPDDPRGAILQALVLRTLNDRRMYRAIAHRTPRQAPALMKLAAAKLGHAKRLSAAYFLLSGVEYWPADTLQSDTPPAFLAALRDRFLAEQQLMTHYRTMTPCSDVYLSDLFLTLAAETTALTGAVRHLVEQGFAPGDSCTGKCDGKRRR